MAKSVTAGKGKLCPKCSRSMLRKQHPAGWKPKPTQPYFFEYWDICKKCRHIQHYEEAKVFLGEVRPASKSAGRLIPHPRGPILTPRENFDWVGTAEPYPGAPPWE